MHYQQLSSEERAMIEAFRKAEFTISAIANEIKKNKSTISRELKRNTGRRGYRCRQANERAKSRLREKNIGRLKIKGKIERQIVKDLRQKWSPDQISKWRRNKGLLTDSHETIYQYIYKDKSNGGTLHTLLRYQKKRRLRYRKNRKRRGQIQNRTGIEKRPLHVETRNQYGHMVGKGKSNFLLTLVERKSRGLRQIKLDSKNSEHVAKAIMKVLKKEKVKFITFDNGLEFAMHTLVAETLGTKTFFAEPYSSWQRGTNENLNGLIRQYFPKGTDFLIVSQAELNKMEKEINNRPRSCLEYIKPSELWP